MVKTATTGAGQEIELAIKASTLEKPLASQTEAVFLFDTSTGMTTAVSQDISDSLQGKSSAHPVLADHDADWEM